MGLCIPKKALSDIDIDLSEICIAIDRLRLRSAIHGRKYRLNGRFAWPLSTLCTAVAGRMQNVVTK